MSLSRPVVVTISLFFSLIRVADAEPELNAFPALGNPQAVTVSGRVLKEAVQKDGSALRRNLRRLTATKWVGAPVTLSFEGQTADTVSGDDGFYEVTFTAPPGHPFSVGAHAVETRAGTAVSLGPVDIVADDAPFLVVSDFDDTLAITDVVHKSKLVTSALFQDGDTQPPVPGMAAAFRCLAARPGVKPGFALVSGSPQQYVPRTMTFLRANDFPFLGLYLRDIGPGTLSGYKEPVIRRLLTRFPALPVVAFGDSGEHDPEVYATLRREFPGRFAAVYIRDAGHAAPPSRFEGMRLFRDVPEVHDDLVAHGWADAGCLAARAP